jgi:hypothetical protein
MNIAEGVALCPSCGRLSRLSQIIEFHKPMRELIDHPPRGCTLINRGAGSTVLTFT